MGMNSLWKMLLPVCFLAGCGSAESTAPKPPEKTVFDPLVQHPPRARDVQKAVDANAERTRLAADAQERGAETR
jgi:hypothetical protein